MQTQTLSSSRPPVPKKTRPLMTLPLIAPPTPFINPPASPVAPKQSSQSGWDYWTRVYSDDSQPPPASRDVRVSDMLSSDTLVRAKLLFLNVPNLPPAHKSIIMNLVKKEIRDDISIQDVIVVPPGKWFLNFFRAEDALKVLKYFEGFSYRGHTLAVRFCYPDGTYGDEAALTQLVQCSNNAKGRLFEKKEIVQDTITPESWTVAQCVELKIFETEIMNLLKAHAYLPYHNVLQAMNNLFTIRFTSSLSSIFISEALTQWPTGVIRIFNRSIKVISNTVCLSTSSYYTQRIHDSALEGGCTIHRNTWEPITPEDIRSDVQLILYFNAFLLHFGPQHIDIDAPIRIVAQSLRGIWPKSGTELATLLTEISSGFVIINRFIYLASNPTHHEKIIDHLATFQDDCSDTYYLHLPCVVNEEEMMVVDFEDL
ncbi:hypothetical protein GCK72_017213 [Caenorhabditis remanei]|uniref:Uncharacterized protein n=1 Tax=Caenorhabditis remanei TaxID=31234 RepID=A0A6A5G7N4_CAERE|nr:hypothetical protein GCK72_017213 [Caenorhabditis remanei]KAF1750662.1 hypothetical protein GCK72_017213 [Caenorhabditis remanei]